MAGDPRMLLFVLVGVAGLVEAWRRSRRLEQLSDTPTSRAAAVFVGYNELEVRAVSGTPTASRFAQVPALWWEARVEVEEIDRSGRNKRRRWTVRDLTSHDEPFVVADATGSLTVQPRSAEVHGREVLRTVLRGDDAEPFLHLARREHTGRVRLVEEVVTVGQELFVTGHAAPDAEGDDLHLSTDAGPMTVAVQREQALTRSARRGAAASWLTGVGALSFSAPVLAYDELRTGTVALVAGALAAATLLGLLVQTWNRLRRVHTRYLQAVSLVDVQLARRSDLVPSLVAVVRAAGGHEAAVQAALARLRAESDGPEAVRGLLAVAEATPAVVAEASYGRLRDELTATENAVQGAREFAVGCLEILRTRLSTFPGLLLRPLSAGLLPATGPEPDFVRTAPQRPVAVDVLPPSG